MGVEELKIVYFLKEKGYSDKDILTACREPCLKLDKENIQLNIDNYNVMKNYKKEPRTLIIRAIRQCFY